MLYSCDREKTQLIRANHHVTAAIITAACVLIFVSAFVSLLALPVQAAGKTDNRDSIAVIIGNRDYGDTVVKVAYAINDASAMADFLIQKLGFRKGNVIVLKNATGGKLVEWFGDQQNPKGKLWDWVRAGRSNVFVYYSGHGAPDPQTRQSYLIPTDVDPERASRGYGLQLLQRNLEIVKKKIGAKRHVVLMLDACFSGKSAGGAIQKTSAGAYTPIIPRVDNSITRLSASGARQVANWDPSSKHGLMTSLFLKGVTGDADKDGFGNNDGNVSWAEISDYQKSEVSYKARREYGRDQSPQISGATALPWHIKAGAIKMTRQPDKAKKTAESSSCDRDEYKDLKEIESIEAWDEFLKQCRTGKLARLARAYRDKLVRTRDEKKGLEALREKQKNELAIKQRELEKRLLALKKQQQRVYQSNEGDLAIMEPDNRITRPPVGRCHVVRIKKWDPDGGLNIRTGPSVRNRKIGVIPYDGVGVVKHRCQTRGRSTWCNITYRGTRGWVSANFISCY